MNWWPRPIIEPVYFFIEDIWKPFCPFQTFLSKIYSKQLREFVLLTLLLISCCFVNKSNNTYLCEGSNKNIGLSGYVFL